MFKSDLPYLVVFSKFTSLLDKPSRIRDLAASKSESVDTSTRSSWETNDHLMALKMFSLSVSVTCANTSLFLTARLTSLCVASSKN